MVILVGYVVLSRLKRMNSRVENKAAPIKKKTASQLKAVNLGRRLTIGLHQAIAWRRG